MNEQNIQVLFLQEIDLKYYMNGMMAFPGCETFVNGGPKKRVASVVKHGTFASISQLNQGDEKAQVWLQVETSAGQKMTLGNVYREWNERQEEDMDELCRLAEDCSGEIIMAGDFNLDPSRIKDPTYGMARKTATFLARMEGAGLSQVSFGSTFKRTVEKRMVTSELDWLLCSQPDLVVKEGKTEIGISDHDLIIWTLKTQKQPIPTKRRMGREIGKINEQAFRHDLAHAPWEALADVDSVEEMAGQLHSVFLSVLDKHAPQKEIIHKKKFSLKPSGRLRRLRRLRDNARSKGKIECLRKLRRECEKLSAEECIQRVEERLNTKPEEAWKVFKEVMGKKREQCQSIREGDRVLDPEEASNTFNDYFPEKIKQIQKSLPPFTGDALQGAKQRAQQLGLKNGEFRLLPTNEKTVAKAMSRSKNSHCPDIYGISPAALKLAPDILAVPLTWVINKTIITGTVPAVWKKGRVMPCHKKGSKELKENYRPVCILPSMGKVMEEIVRGQITSYFEKKNVLPKSQFGFRAKRSTVLATAVADHDWKTAKQAKLQCGALFFDLSAAFDCIDSELLVAKMEIYGATKNVLDWTRSYLSGRRQRVDFCGASSRVVNTCIGSPQGSVISPLLFLILVADMEEWVTDGVVIGYADDTTVYCIGSKKDEVIARLEKSAEEVLLFMAATRLSANPSKTKYIYFSGRREKPIKVGNIVIEESQEETLLGLTFSKRLSWKAHLDKIKPELQKRIAMLRRLGTRLPRQLLCSFIEPIFTAKLRYALELIVDSSLDNERDTVLQALHSLHRSAMKSALGLSIRQHPTDENLYKRTGQTSVCQMAAEATACLAWRCGQDWGEHPLTAGRVKEHWSRKNTRQATQRSLPPQPTPGSLVTRIVEMWEKMPTHVKEAKDYGAAKARIKDWILTELKPSF